MVQLRVAPVLEAAHDQKLRVLAHLVLLLLAPATLGEEVLQAIRAAPHRGVAHLRRRHLAIHPLADVALGVGPIGVVPIGVGPIGGGSIGVGSIGCTLVNRRHGCATVRFFWLTQVA